MYLNKIYILLFKYTNNKLPQFFKRIFNPNEQNVKKLTRQNKLFTVTRPNTSHGSLMMNNYCTKLWQELNNNTKCITSETLFKKSVKETLLNSYC